MNLIAISYKLLCKLIDNEVRSLVDMCYKRTQKLLENKKEQVKNLAEELLEKEVIYKEDVEKIIGAREFFTDI